MKLSKVFFLFLALALASAAILSVASVNAQAASVSLYDVKVNPDPDSDDIFIRGKVKVSGVVAPPWQDHLSVDAEFRGRTGEWPVLYDNWNTKCADRGFALGDRCLTDAEIDGVDFVRDKILLRAVGKEDEWRVISFDVCLKPPWGVRYMRITARLGQKSSQHPSIPRRYYWAVSKTVYDLKEFKGDMAVVLTYSPERPKPTHTMTFTAQALAADGTTLLTREKGAEYEWYLDGKKLPVNASTAFWKRPPEGRHTVRVKVSHKEEGTAEHSVTFWVGYPSGGSEAKYTYGYVQFKRADSDKWQRLRQGEELGYGDEVRTLPGAKAEIRLSGCQLVRLEERSHLIIPKPRRIRGEKPSILKLFMGSIWCEIKGLIKGKVEVQTYPTCAASIKGTKFEMTVEEDGTTIVRVFEGIVEVSDINMRKTVSLNAGQSTICKPHGVPSDPEPFDPASLDRWWESFPEEATPSPQDPWEDPELIACIEEVLTEFVAEADAREPDLAPHWVDQWGNWRNKAIIGAQQPDDWWTRWRGNRYFRICCGWIPPRRNILQSRCNCPCESPPGVVAVGEEPPPPPVPGTEPPPGFTFYAVYERLVDAESLNARIHHSAMSGDGNKLVFSGTDNTTRSPVLYTVNANGTGLRQIALPDLGGAGIEELVTDRDGSRAFFRAGRGLESQFYKVEVPGGLITKIFDANDYPEVRQCDQIQATANGEYLYFLNSGGYNGDVWRITYGGAGLAKVIEDRNVSSETTYGVGEFAISADASIIAFLLDPLGGSNKELFILEAGGYHQLTTDRVDKLQLDISGDGATVVFAAGGKWYSIRSHGSSQTSLEDAGFNFAGSDLPHDGKKMVYTDAGANGGRLVHTDGSGRLDLFPGWNVRNITIAGAEWSISDDGRRISFIFQSNLYVGYFNNPHAVSDAPVIHNIAFNPSTMPRGDPNARVTVTSQITDPQGLTDITNVSTDEIVNGRHGWREDSPVYFTATNDKGLWPDQTAGDGTFSTEGKPGAKINELNQVTVRVAAMDSSKTVVVADTTLWVGTPSPKE